MEDEKLVKCANCGKEVPEFQLDRWGECNTCRAADRAGDMGVGDIKNR